MSRKGDVLTIKLDNGKTRKIADAKACKIDDETNCTTYSLSGYRPAQNFYLVRWSAWEGGGVLLVSGKTGEEIQLNDDPRFSPSGHWFVVPGAEYDDQLSIWSLEAGEAKQELAYNFVFPGGRENWDFLGWDGETRIRLQVSPADTDKKDVETDAVLKDQGWVLNWPFP